MLGGIVRLRRCAALARYESQQEHEQLGLELAVLGRKAHRLASILKLNSHLGPQRQKLQEWTPEQVWRPRSERALS